jgi:hypothetical protein
MEHNVNGYTLQPEIYVHNGSRLVRIYSPIMIIDGMELFWVYCLDDKDVIVVDANKLKLANNRIQVFYGGK